VNTLDQSLVLDIMRRVLVLASESDDPSSQSGAAIVDRFGSMVAAACNGPTKGVVMTPERWERPAKYAYMEHAERSVIYQAARDGQSLDGLFMFAPWAACADCARAIVSSGIVGLVRLDNTPHGQWADSIARGDEILTAGGVKIVTIRGQFGVELRRDGKTVTF
jgi:deoxycytidylate deaminase